MTRVQQQASVAPSTVTRLSEGALEAPRRARGPRTGSPAVRDTFETRVDPRIMDALRGMGADFHYVEVVSETEVIIRNQKVR